MKSIPVFDDEYKGPRFTYQLNYRPLALYAVPDGWIIGSNRPGATAFGTVDYPFKLTDEQVHSFELTPVKEA